MIWIHKCWQAASFKKKNTSAVFNKLYNNTDRDFKLESRETSDISWCDLNLYVFSFCSWRLSDSHNKWTFQTHSSWSDRLVWFQETDEELKINANRIDRSTSRASPGLLQTLQWIKKKHFAKDNFFVISDSIKTAIGLSDCVFIHCCDRWIDV